MKRKKRDPSKCAIVDCENDHTMRIQHYLTTGTWGFPMEVCEGHGRWLLRVGPDLVRRDPSYEIESVVFS